MAHAEPFMKHSPADHPAPFGAVLGIGPGGVAVYSSDYDTVDREELPTRQAFRSYVDGVYMGHKWQCVELARRWMYVNCGYVFDDIAMAYDIFSLRHVRRIEDGALLPLRSFRNGGMRPLEPGALIIWNEGGEFEVTGHVAVVTEATADRVRIIEQNVEDTFWPDGQTWSRELPLGRTAGGGWRLDCTIPGGEILGWVIQTEDASHAETIEDPDPALFALVPRDAKTARESKEQWLDAADPAQAAFMRMMGGSRLATEDADLGRYFHIGETAWREIRRATNELHRMFLHATNHVLSDDALLQRFNIPPLLWPRIHQSWNNRRNQAICGRFDFSLSERGLKLYEYNIDSASCLMETGLVQGRWADRFGCTEGRCPGRDLHEDLVDAWREAGIDGTVHILLDHDLEETYHALYMKTALEAAGIDCKVVRGVAGLQWDADGWVCDADGDRIRWVWKTWAWETALDQIRDELTDDQTELALHHTIDPTDHSPRIVDILLREEVMVFEPLWTLVTSNKALLPVLRSMYPNSRYLLDTQYELTDGLRASGHVVKPIVGRRGENIAIYDRREDLVGETGGRFDDRDQIYQELFRLPRIDRRNAQIGTFAVAGAFSAACTRVDASPIIVAESDVLPLRVVPDDVLRDPT